MPEMLVGKVRERLLKKQEHFSGPILSACQMQCYLNSSMQSSKPYQIKFQSTFYCQATPHRSVPHYLVIGFLAYFSMKLRMQLGSHAKLGETCHMNPDMNPGMRPPLLRPPVLRDHAGTRSNNFTI